jgi:hypothetical protein
VNVKRVYRLYLEEGLSVRRKKRKHLVRDRAVDPRLVAQTKLWLQTNKYVQLNSSGVDETRKAILIQRGHQNSNRRTDMEMCLAKTPSDREIASLNG